MFLRSIPSTSKCFTDISLIRNIVRSYSNENDKLLKVDTTGYWHLDKDGKKCAKYGIYWGPNDPRNVLRSLPPGSTNVGAMLESLLEVINIAREEEPPPPLLIYSDMNKSESFLKDLSLWAKRDFYQRNQLEKMKHAEVLNDIFLAVQGMNLKIVNRPSEVGGKNHVAAQILDSIRSKIPKIDSGTKEMAEYCRTTDRVEPVARLGFVKVGDRIDKNGKEANEDEINAKWPSVYVGVKIKMKEGFYSAGYCTHWPSGEFGGGRSFRFAPLPITPFRATLAAVEEALKQAVDCKHKNIVIRLASAHFLTAFRQKWIRNSGEKYTGAPFYARIMDLCDRIDNVHFVYEKENKSLPIYKEIDKKCQQGLSSVLMGKDKSEYELTTDDLIRDRRCRELGTPIVRIFKSGTEKNAGYVWEGEKTGTSGVGPPDILLKVFEEAESRNQSSIIIRTDSTKLIKTFEAYLEVWHRNGWRNSQHKKISKREGWEKAWEYKQRIHVNFELMDEYDKEDELENGRVPQWIK